MNQFDKHLKTVNACQICSSGFSRSPNGKNYRFPPLIGATGHASILFVGINPRISESNKVLHERLLNSEESFRLLARNRLEDGSPYISLKATERHYHSHMLIVEGVFGSGCPFEAKAAVTELFLCASMNAPSLWQTRSVCAERFLKTSISLVEPKVIVAVGATVRKHLKKHFDQMLAIPLVEMEHPRFHFNLTFSERRKRLRSTIDAIKNLAK
jgi:uracil-DNA glycosylase